MSDRCEICGKTIHPADTYVEQVYGKTLELCMHCSTMVTSASGVNANNKLIGRKYLKGKLDEGVVPPENVVLVKQLAGEGLSGDEHAQLHGIAGADKEASTQETEQPVVSEPAGSVQAGTVETVSSGMPFGAGLVFLVLAVILYFVSVNNEYGVANIQTTVFAGASFVAAIVCFATSRIIKAINSK